MRYTWHTYTLALASIQFAGKWIGWHETTDAIDMSNFERTRRIRTMTSLNVEINFIIIADK